MNEEIKKLMEECPKITRQPLWMIMEAHDENPRDYEYDDYEPDYELQAEMDEANLWNF